ncbi:MAG TPA: tetratricopeptide repeat protein [Rhizomicrobium sp.]|nr:tetratricopeptide repeat protein [Rhizomicrobium sp.]
MTASTNAHYEQGLKLSKKGRHAEAIDCYQQALAASPSDTHVLFALGNTARALGMARPAETFYRQVLAIEPQRIEALINLANLLRANGQASAARALLEPAIVRDPQGAELWLTLGSVLRESGDADAAEIHYRRALELKPGSATALANLADMLAAKGERENALALYDRAIRQEPDNAQALLNRAILHLLTGNLKQGWRDYSARLDIPGKAPRCDHGLKAWTGDTLKNKRLLVTAEQGVGDQLMFAALIPDLAARAAAEGGSVILECEPRLVPLFARSFDAITVHASEMQMRAGVVDAKYGWLKSLGGANLAIEMGSLPRFLRGEIARFPNPNVFLDADEIEILNWQRTFSSTGDGPFIGICWRSGKLVSGRALNFAPLEAWAQFVRDMPGTPVCVQYDATQEEIEMLGALSGKTVVVPGGIDQKQELDRACALVSALDAVVSAPTAVSWLSAGAGVPTYKIERDAGWTSFGLGYEPFAPAARCMVPDVPGDWANGFEKALAALSLQFG